MDMVIADMRDEFAVKLVPDFYALAFENKNIRFQADALIHRQTKSTGIMAVK
jgi:hypothetical protein